MKNATLKAYALVMCTGILISQCYSQLIEKPTIKPTRGWYDHSIEVNLSAGNKDFTIFYTLDGTEPSDSNGLTYESPIEINESTIVKARTYLSEKVFSNVISHTYLLESSVLSQSDSIEGWQRPLIATSYGNFPIKFDYEMDPKITQAPEYIEEIRIGLTSVPTMALSMDRDDFWRMTITNEEFPVSIELIYPDGESEQVDGGIEGMSHKHMKRNYRLSFKKKYGPSKFDSDIFSKYAPLHKEGAAKEFDQIVLRAGTQRSWARDDFPDRNAFTRDQWYRDTQLDMSAIGPRGSFMHIFVNGIYFGLYNVTERPDEHFFASYFGGEDEQWYAMNHNGTIEGDSQNFYYLMDSIITRDVADPAIYDELQNYLDVPQFCDYIILGWFIGMSDWPENNFYAGSRVESPTPLRFVAWDAELSWDDKKDSYPGAHVHPLFLPGEEAYSPITQIWHALIKNKDFLQTFADRVYFHSLPGGALTDKACIDRWQMLNEVIKEAVIVESARWGDVLEDSITRTRDDHWKIEVERVSNMMKGNMDRFLQAIKEEGYYPKVDPPLWNELYDLSSGKPFSMSKSPESEDAIIYYTLDGEDPRLPGGKLSEKANTYKEPFTVKSTSKITARTLQDSVWSAVHEFHVVVDVVEN